jgi:hypothetical protein
MSLKLDLAKQLGAVCTVNALKADPIERSGKWVVQTSHFARLSRQKRLIKPWDHFVVGVDMLAVSAGSVHGQKSRLNLSLLRKSRITKRRCSK